MRTSIQSYKLILIFAIVISMICWILWSDYPFQKGGVETYFYYEIILLNLVMTMFLSLILNSNNIIERMVTCIIACGIGLIVSTNITISLVETFYNGKTWFLWESKHRIIGNSLYYGIMIGTDILSLLIYSTIRKNYKARSLNLS